MMHNSYLEPRNSYLILHPSMLIDRFLEYLRLERNRSPLTVKAYKADLDSFSAFLDGKAGESISDEGAEVEKDSGEAGMRILEADTRIIREWLAEEAERGCAPRSLRRKAQSLRSFYNWAVTVDLLKSSPAAGLELAKTPRSLPNFVPAEEMEEVGAKRLATDPVLEKRNHLIVELLYTCGLRQAELRSIVDADLDYNRAELKVHGKGGKTRIVPLAPSTISMILEWRKIRDGVVLESQSGATGAKDRPHQIPLITGRGGNPISASQLQNIVKDALTGTRSLRRSPHTLRHSFATAMLNGGADIMTVKEILGHSSLSSTQIYTHLNFKELQRDYRNAHPRGGGVGESKG